MQTHILIQYLFEKINGSITDEYLSIIYGVNICIHCSREGIQQSKNMDLRSYNWSWNGYEPGKHLAVIAPTREYH